MGDYVEVQALDSEGIFRAYRAQPGGTPTAAIIVVQEVFGVNAGIRAKCDDWAARGFLALAPDMFWRFKPGYDVDPDVPDQLQDAMQVRLGFDPEAGVRDVEATIRAARAALGGNGKVGVVGYCMGGKMAYLAATRTDADASVGYYGAGINAQIGEARAIAKPLMLHFAGDDGYITPDAVATVRDGLAGNAHAQVFVYEGVDHGFATTSGKRRVDHAGSDAKAERARALGADHALSCPLDGLAGEVRRLTNGRGAELVLDSVGQASWASSVAAVAPRGLLVTYGNASGPVPPVVLLDLVKAGSIFLTRPSVWDYIATRAELEAATARLFSLVQVGTISVEIGRTLPLDEAAEAHRALEARETTGATVLIP